MHITLKQLHVFTMTAKHGSISKAAKYCFISQPAASIALQQLENQLNTPLFDRVGKRLQLNANGKFLLDKACAIIDQATELEAFSDASTKNIIGSVNIGASLTIGNYILPHYLASFKQQHPQVKFQVSIYNTERIIDDLLALNLDIGLIEGQYYQDMLQSQTWIDDELVIIAREQHPLTQKKVIDTNDLGKFNWVSREQGSGTAAILETRAKDQFPLSIEIVLDSFEAIKRYVANSDCLSCVSSRALQAKAHNNLHVLKVTKFSLNRPLSLLINQKKHQTHAAIAFQEYLFKGM